MMDRESRPTEYTFEAGTTSPSISTARAGWQSIHLGPTIAAGNITYESLNEVSKTWVVAKDSEGADVAVAAVSPGDVVPVPLEVNHGRVYRLNFSAPQPAEAKFVVVNKV